MAETMLVLQLALDSFGEEGEHWGKDAYAAKADGTPCGVMDPECDCRCAMGAITNAAFALNGPNLIEPTNGRDIAFATDALQQEIPDGFLTVVDWNDNPGVTFDAVRETFNRAIGRAA